MDKKPILCNLGDNSSSPKKPNSSSRTSLGEKICRILPAIGGMTLVGGFVGLIVLLTAGQVDIHTKVNGNNVNYWQTPGSCRELTITEPSGMKTEIYDKNDDNIIGNYTGDFVRLSYPNGVGVKYLPDGAEISCGDQKVSLEKLLEAQTREILTPSGAAAVDLKPTDEAFSEYTQVFNQYRDILMPKG